jgi:hypothetical protein
MVDYSQMPDPLNAFAKGYGLAEGMRQDRARRQAGNALAGGDMAGGQNALYRAGMLEDAGQMQDRQYRNEELQYRRDARKQETEAVRRKDLLERRGQVIAALQRTKAAGGDVVSAYDTYVPLFLDSEPDPARRQELQGALTNLRGALAQNPDAVLTALGEQTAKEWQAVNLGNGGFGAFNPQTKQFDVLREPQYEQEYVALPPGGALVPKPRGNMPPQTVTAGQGGGDWLGAVSAAAPDAQVTSGLRTPERNAAVGGVPNSRHLSGQAVDLVPRPGETMAQLHARVSKVPGVKAINEGDHVHVQVVSGQAQSQYPAGTIMGPPDTKRSLEEENLRSQIAERNQKVANGGVTPQQSRKEVANIRKEFNNLEEVKNWKDVSASYNQVKALATKPNPTAADDIALTFSFMKMLDPGSVVREGEYALVGRSAGLDDQIIMGLQRIDSGKGLTPEIRRKLRAAASEIVLQRRAAFDQVSGQYRELVGDAGGSPDQLAEAPGAWRGRIRAPGGSAPRGSGQPVRVKTPEEARALKPGTVFITPDGRRKVR